MFINKKTTKLLSIFLMLLMCLSIVSCGKSLSGNMKIGTLVGPTGMGLIDLKDNSKIDFEIYQAPTDVVQKLISGDLDVACVPSNLGGVLYAKTGGNIQILTTVVNGVLYIVENGKKVQSLQDLKGKTIFGSGKGGTPEYALQILLKSAGLKLGKDVKVKWLENHADVAQKVASRRGAIGLLPEPQVSAITSKTKQVKIALDLNSLWLEVTGKELPMGILVAKRDYIKENKANIDELLLLVAESIQDVTSANRKVIKKIVKAGIVSDADLCEAVIPNCSLTCMSAKENKKTISIFYKKLFEANPSSLGGAMPDDDIYYGIK